MNRWDEQLDDCIEALTEVKLMLNGQAVSIDHEKFHGGAHDVLESFEHVQSILARLAVEVSMEQIEALQKQLQASLTS